MKSKSTIEKQIRALHRTAEGCGSDAEETVHAVMFRLSAKMLTWAISDKPEKYTPILMALESSGDLIREII